MEIKDLLLVDCLACLGFGGRPCLKQSLGVVGSACYAVLCVC